MARAIVMLKYQQVTPLAGWFAAQAGCRWCGSNAAQFAADVVVPVPLHRARQRERGYNQAELIAKSLAKRARAAVPLSPAGAHAAASGKAAADRARTLAFGAERFRHPRGRAG